MLVLIRKVVLELVSSKVEVCSMKCSCVKSKGRPLLNFDGHEKQNDGGSGFKVRCSRKSCSDRKPDCRSGTSLKWELQSEGEGLVKLTELREAKRKVNKHRSESVRISLILP